MRLRRILIVVLVVLGLVFLFIGGLAVRRAVLDAQFDLYGRDLPFMRESALEFRYVRMLFRSGQLPAIDHGIQAPDGVNVRQTFEIGAEYVYALLAKCFPAGFSLTERVRWISAGWFCLGIPLLCMWLWWWLRSGWAAAVGGAYYAVSLASVVRSTGQELSHENFALPLLIGHLGLGVLAHSQKSPRLFWLFSCLSALLLGCALMTWDLVQFYVLLWAVLGFFRLVRGRYFQDARHVAQWMLLLLVLAAAGGLNPYLRAHAFLASYAMLLAYGVGLGIVLDKIMRLRAGANACRRICTGPDAARTPGKYACLMKLLPVAAALLPLLVGSLCWQAYAAHYGHFLDLLWAKLVFLNQKPSDPSLLNFDQRILWAPALNSANLYLTLRMFPVSLLIAFVILPITLFESRYRADPEIKQYLFYGFVSLLIFTLFVRFHVFTVIFFAAFLGWLVRWAVDRGVVARWVLVPLLVCGVGLEAANTLYDPARWGSVPAYFKQQREVAEWFREHGQGEPVLANFGVGAFLLTYGNCPIILHPKFESPDIRNRVRTYGEALFKGDEERFRTWADKHHAKYYVYSLGEFADVHPELQMRYCVNALNPPPYAAARVFEREPENAWYFIYLWGNAKYRVFRIITGDDERLAAQFTADAAREFAHGNWERADGSATAALMYNPRDKDAIQLLLHINSLKEQGVK